MKPHCIPSKSDKHIPGDGSNSSRHSYGPYEINGYFHGIPYIPLWDYPLVNEHNYGKSPFYSWVNPLFLWPFSIAMLVIARLGSSVLGPGCVWHRNFAGLTAVHPHWGAAVGQRRCGHRGSLGGEGGRDACPGAESKTGGTWHRFKKRSSGR